MFIKKEDWDISGVLPGTIVSDLGGEYQSETFAQIKELGITLVNLPPLRPELKSIVERSFELKVNVFHYVSPLTGIYLPFL